MAGMEHISMASANEQEQELSVQKVSNDTSEIDSQILAPESAPSEDAVSIDLEPPSAPERDGEKLPRQEEEEMFRALKEMFQNADEDQGSFDMRDLLSSLEQADQQARHGRLSFQTLKKVSTNLGLLWRSKSEYMAPCAEILANGSRNPAWRAPYGRSGILDFFLRVIASKGVEDDIMLHSLRLVGNSCADTDENRQRVVDKNYTRAIVRLFGNPALTQVTIPVMYNICADFEPAQLQAAENGTGFALLNLLAKGAVKGDALMSYTYELVEMASEQSQGVARSPDSTLSTIISLATDSDTDFAGFAVIVNCLAAYLQNERFQQVCVSNKLVEQVTSVLLKSFDLDLTSLSSEENQTLAQLRLRLNQSLSDVSALPLFSKLYPLGCALINTLRSWLERSEDQLEICACVMLGNIAREDKVCEVLVRDYQVHLPLISILSGDAAKGSVLHAALGILKNLAIAVENKERLGESGIIKAVSHVYAFDTLPQVQFSAASLTRQLIVSCFNNILRLLEPYSADPDSPANSLTYLSLLLSLSTKTDNIPIKTEVGRAIAAICRSISQRQQEGLEASTEASSLSERLFKLHEDVARPVGAMIAQTEWPVVQSEGWFALALMASTPSGSLAVVDCLQSMSVFQLLEENMKAVISEPENGEAAQEKTDRLKKSKDRDNAIVLVSELLKNNPSTLSSTRRDMLQDLMREATEASRR